MSGLFPGGGSDNDLTSHFNQRFYEIRKRNPNVSSAGPLSSGISDLGESVVNGQYFNNRGPGNGTINTQQFYQGTSNQAPSQLQAERNVPPKQLYAEGSSTYTSASDASVFKKPLPMKKLSIRAHFQRRLDLLMENIRTLDDKPTLKFVMTVIEALLHSVKKPPNAQPVNPVLLMDYISSLVKEDYDSKQVPKSICGSSIMSDQTSNIDQYAKNSERSSPLGKPLLTSVYSDANNSERSSPLGKPLLTSVYSVSEVRVALQDCTQSSSYRHLFRPPQDFIGPEYSLDERAELSSYQVDQDIAHPQQACGVSVAAQEKGRPPLGQQLMDTENAFNLLNDSEVARMRDEAVARQESMSKGKVGPEKSDKTFPKPTTKPALNCNKLSKIIKASAAVKKKPANRHSKGSVPDSEKCGFDLSNKNISLLNGTVNGVSRHGRTLKAPVKYWNSKGEELRIAEPDESPFNDSTTLRNKKVINKKKTPPIKGSKNNTPLTSVPENVIAKSSTAKKPRGRLPGKENLVSEKKKPEKKQTHTAVKKNTLTKGKTNKKNEEAIKQTTEKGVKKPLKRKYKESDDSTPKKKKIEVDPAENFLDNEEDLFGGLSYRKATHQALKLAVSPSGGLVSAKKAAGVAQGKATPPCKAIGDFMINESIQSAMSAAKEAPKQHEAIKRVIKKMEKNKMKPMQQLKPKTQVNKTKKEDSHLDKFMEAAKTTYSVNNSMCSATLTIFKGTAHDSDSSDMDQDDVEDLM